MRYRKTVTLGSGVTGNTADSGSVIQGSIPCSPTSRGAVRSTDPRFASRRECQCRALAFALLCLALNFVFWLQYFGSGIPSTKQIERLAIRTQSSRSGCIPSSSIKPCALAERQAQQVVMPFAKLGELTLSK